MCNRIIQCFPLSSSERFAVSRKGSQVLGTDRLLRPRGGGGGGGGGGFGGGV